MIHQNRIKLADFGLSKRIEDVLSTQPKVFGRIPYVDLKKFSGRRNNLQPYTLNEKSDVYSVGMLLWEISSGRAPFNGELYDVDLIHDILGGLKETIVPDTPEDYVKIYTGKCNYLNDFKFEYDTYIKNWFNMFSECWDNEPNNRPFMNHVVVKLKAIVMGVENDQTNETNDKPNLQLSNEQQ